MPLVREILRPSQGKVERGIRPDFHAGQRQAWRSQKRIVAVIAGVRSGKTSFAAFWLWREMIRCGPGDYLMVAPNYPLIDKAAGPEIQSLFERQLRLGQIRTNPWQFRVSLDGHKRLWPTIPHERPSRVLFGHADDPDSLEAMTVKAAWLDECGQKRFRLASWEAVRARLSIDRGRALLTSRPYDLGWLKQKIYDPWHAANGNHPEIDLIRFDSTANPAFPPEEWEQAQRDLPGWKFDMVYRARFERPAGLVYDSFDTDRHVVTPFKVDDKWPRYLGLDFGGVNTCALYFAKDPRDGTLYIYREYYPRTARTARQHVEAILAGEPTRPTACGGSMSEGQWRSEFAAAGLGVLEPAVKEVDVGIARVYSAFANDRVKVFQSCHRFLEEVATYSYATDDAGNPKGDGSIEDKNDYHCFVAGTMVATDKGNVPIENIKPGQMILTRAGYRRAVACFARDNQPLLAVELDNGTCLTGTGNHPIFTDFAGFVPLDSLRYNDEVVTLSQSMENACFQRGSKDSRGRRFGCTGLPGSATPTHLENLTASIFAMREPTYTGSSGKCTTARYRKDATSTTLTATRQTTCYRTSNCSVLGITHGTITLAFARPGSGRISIESGSWLPRGMAVQRGSNGTENTGGGWLRTSPLCQRSANGASRPTLARGRDGQTDTARTTASVPHASPAASMTFNGFACPVINPLPSIGTQGPSVAHARVRNVSAAGKGTVYNLTVAGEHEYFANGILVGNCLDAARYLIGWLLRPGGATQIHSDKRGSVIDNAPKGIFMS